MSLNDVERALGLQPSDNPLGRPRETQATMSRWAVDTFGPTKSNLSVAIRANEEMAELLAKLRDDDDDIEAAIEAADVIVIVLMRMFDRMGVEFSEVIDAKMELNRRRRWVSTNTGHGYHVRDGSEGG